MRTRIIAVIVLAVFALGIAATAQVAKSQNRENVKMQAGAKCRIPAEKLGLTPDQRESIAGIAKAYYAEIKPILQSNATPEEKKAQIEPIRARAIDAIMAQLTPEQQAKAREMGLVDKMLRPFHNRAAKGIMYALSQLGLTEQQKAAIKDIFQISREKAKTIKDNTALTPEQKRVQFKELRTATHDQVMSVLTPEQQQKLQEMIEKHKQKGPRDGQTQKQRPAGQKTRVK